jgi:hypothetical protein
VDVDIVSYQLATQLGHGEPGADYPWLTVMQCTHGIKTMGQMPHPTRYSHLHFFIGCGCVTGRDGDAIAGAFLDHPQIFWVFWSQDHHFHHLV